jgi:Spy/CpxP family protein refolding chaperone
MNRQHIAWGLTFAVVGAFGLAGAHHVAFADPEPGAADVSGAQEEWMGPLHGLGEALDALPLRADQRASVEQLKADLKAQSAPVRAAHERVMEAVAASVEAGAVDHATIDPAVSAAQAAAEANRPSFQDAANRLHAILDAGQRQQLVDALRARMHGRHGLLHGLRGGDGLARVADELGLSDDQRTAIQSRFEALRQSERAAHEQDRATMRDHFDHMKAIAEAFVSDTFDAHALGLGDGMPKVGEFAGGHLARIDAALPLLTPPQRVQLAQMIRTKRLAQLLHE